MSASDASEVETGLGKPDRVDVGPDQVLVREFEARRRDLARDHQPGRRKKYWSCGLPRRAVVEDKVPAAASARAPGSLGIVGRRRWDVPQVDDVELGDVDAELHRRRAVEDRQSPVAESLLALVRSAAGT